LRELTGIQTTISHAFGTTMTATCSNGIAYQRLGMGAVISSDEPVGGGAH
jgi:hypothetical protein